MQSLALLNGKSRGIRVRFSAFDVTDLSETVWGPPVMSFGMISGTARRGKAVPAPVFGHHFDTL
jgi:hypothetical protein